MSVYESFTQFFTLFHQTALWCDYEGPEVSEISQESYELALLAILQFQKHPIICYQMIS